MGGNQSANDKTSASIDSVKVSDGAELPSGGYRMIFDNEEISSAGTVPQAKLSAVEDAYNKGKEEGLQSVQQALSVVAAQVSICVSVNCTASIADARRILTAMI